MTRFQGIETEAARDFIAEFIAITEMTRFQGIETVKPILGSAELKNYRNDPIPGDWNGRKGSK